MKALRQNSKKLPENVEKENIENKTTEDHEGKAKNPTPIRSNNPTSGWIRKFLKRPENKWLEEIERDFLNDFTNLIGLEEEISHMSQGLHAIMSDGLYLDSNGNSRIHSKPEGKYLEAAETLYGLIHARYLFTNKGFAKILHNYTEGKYGLCPRHYCINSWVLPIGISDKINQGKVKVYCPSCEDIYHPSLPRDEAPDGAYFGMNLPQMFFMTYPRIRPQLTIGHYVPRLHGFKIHSAAYLVKCESKHNCKSISNRSTSKPKRASKLDESKENVVVRDKKLTKFPQLGQGQKALAENIKQPARRRRRKRNEEDSTSLET